MRETTNYILLSEKALGKLTNINKIRVLYLIIGVEAALIWKMYKKIEDQEADIKYYKDGYDWACEKDELLKNIKES